MTPTALKARVIDAVRRRPGPFTFADIADDLGEDFASGGSAERRLRRALDALRRSGAVAVTGRGVMCAGGGDTGSGVEMTRAVEALMRDNGGVMRAQELRDALDLDDTGRRTLHRVLEMGGYVSLPPMHDGRRWWSLADADRLALASPGWRIEIDLALENLRAGRPWRSSVGAINVRRRAIGWGIQDARDAADLDLESVLEVVGGLFIADLGRGQAPVLTPTVTVRLGDYWRGQIEREGREAVRRAWIELEEGGDLGDPWPGSALSSATWTALARVVGADPAALSRGSPATTPNP
ncbi:hypothetical protein [Brevundimonas sp.]|uniref:hypothetical protein n=1 Tax=Brevundimonas sp. TaxID=1871086 RepID=UPI0035AFB5EA